MDHIMLNWCTFALFLLIGISKEIQTFEVFWNVPSSICKQFGIDFELSAYNITQNINDEFFGEQIGILYDPVGLFPVYTSQQGTFVPRNGGIPQLGNMSLHLDELKKLVDLRFPDPQFAGKTYQL
jgi:hyaluronoglucosaminidase